MAIYIVTMESSDGQKRNSICAAGRTRRECIQSAVDEASARDGVVYRAIATTNLKDVVEAPLLPPLPTPRRIHVWPKAPPKPPATTDTLETGPFDVVFEILRKERNRCINRRDVESARGFDQADAELRAAILDEGGGI